MDEGSNLGGATRSPEDIQGWRDLAASIRADNQQLLNVIKDHDHRLRHQGLWLMVCVVALILLECSDLYLSYVQYYAPIVPAAH